jgi:GAF domain-containing protein
VSLAIAEGLSGWVAAQRQKIVNSEVQLDLGDRAGRARLLSFLSAPLIAGDTLVGTITLYGHQTATFTEDHARLVQIIAPHVAQAICTARRGDTGTQPKAVAKSQSPTPPELRLVSTR